MTETNIYCHTVTRSQNGKAPASYHYWCVARYVAKPRKDGVLTWRRDRDLTEGFRSPAKAIREAGSPVILPHVRHDQLVTL